MGQLLLLGFWTRYWFARPLWAFRYLWAPVCDQKNWTASCKVCDFKGPRRRLDRQYIPLCNSYKSQTFFFELLVWCCGTCALVDFFENMYFDPKPWLTSTQHRCLVNPRDCFTFAKTMRGLSKTKTAMLIFFGCPLILPLDLNQLMGFIWYVTLVSI